MLRVKLPTVGGAGAFAFTFHFQFVENCLSDRPQENAERSKKRDAVWAKFFVAPVRAEKAEKVSEKLFFQKQTGASIEFPGSKAWKMYTQ